MSNKKRPVSTVKADSNSAIERWLEFSMNPRTEDEIRQAMLDPSLKDNVCVSYVCQYSLMSSKFIEEFMALSTGVFNFSNYTEENIGFVIDILSQPTDELKNAKLCELQGIYRRSSFLKQFHQYKDGGVGVIGTERAQIQKLDHRIDWYNIQKHQDLEPWFVKKWKHEFNNVSASSKSEMNSWDRE